MRTTHEGQGRRHVQSTGNNLEAGSSIRRVAVPSLGVLLLAGACAEPQQSVKRYQPTGNYAVKKLEKPEPEAAPVENYDERSEAVRRVCNRKAGTELGRCWSDEAGRRKDPKFEARVNTIITVSPEGSATKVQVLNPSNDTSQLEQCIVESAKSWTYPSGQQEVPVQCGFWLRPGV